MSLEFLKKRRSKYETSYKLFFQRKNDYEGNGYAFPCDENGNLASFETEDAKKSYDFVKDNEDYYDGRVIQEAHSWIEDAKVKCNCGNIFYLHDEFCGCGECPECHQWYNLFGQEVIPPEEQMKLEEW